MLGRPILQRTCILSLSAASLLAAAPCIAQTLGGREAATVASPAATDMAMPDDLGAPLPETASAPATSSKVLSVTSPIAVIASSPQGKAVLDRRLPGLCERPEYTMFKGMSLAKLATLSHGRITTAKLGEVQSDLAQVDADRVELVSVPVHSHNPLTESGRSIGRLSHSIYRRMVMVIAAL